MKQILLMVLFIFIASFFFAQTEIQIEGGKGWAKGLPTWRIEEHWLLDIFWGGRPMTGYHAWVFSFMALMFHFPLVILFAFSWKLEARILGSLMIFWIIEDFLWFIFNPAFGIQKFSPAFIPWHKKWLLGLPNDYWVFSMVGIILIYWSFKGSPKSTSLAKS
ncbi:MAG: hypothetical protein HQM08_22180 [Candidatus Riflebacteria bacterium]|nr:hypothetical protein [Candidatus Riflebacteria bacterium]